MEQRQAVGSVCPMLALMEPTRRGVCRPLVKNLSSESPSCTSPACVPKTTGLGVIFVTYFDGNLTQNMRKVLYDHIVERFRRKFGVSSIITRGAVYFFKAGVFLREKIVLHGKVLQIYRKVMILSRTMLIPEKRI